MWDGTFSPKIKKSIGTIRYVPLTSMSPRDWSWLDYDGIRTVARNRIANAIARGDLRGFYQVMIMEKAAKNEYFWPALTDDLREYTENDVMPPFGHVAEVDSEADAAAAVDRIMFGIGLIPLTTLVMILESIRNYLEEQEQEQADQATLEYLEQLDTTAVSLVLLSIMTWLMSLEEAESLLDDLPESDEVDNVRNWIEDRVAELTGTSMQIAAGRGIS